METSDPWSFVDGDLCAKETKVRVNLYQEDIDNLGSFDFVVMGKKNPLVDLVAARTNKDFVEVHEDSGMNPHSWYLLESPEYKWRNTAYVSFNSKRKHSQSQELRLGDVLGYAIYEKRAKRIGILPFSWRDPDYSALVTIYDLWFFGYTESLNSGILWKAEDFVFEIVAIDSIEPYKRILQNHLKEVWKALEDFSTKTPSESVGPSLEDLRNAKVQIEWAEGRLEGDPPKIDYGASRIASFADQVR
ncbi:MAG: hypothetical protein H6752_05800 [Candidatus Omnitrophica bacterium]|nr:hypothetical protein [Candidatus Omnitrophota bacterium]